jgi:hypothetical protein
MKSNIIPLSDAVLVIDRFVKEAIPAFVWFVSGDRSMKVKISGYVSSLTREGLAITTLSPATPPKPGTKLPVFMTVSRESVVASTFRYSDETEQPEDFVLGSGLRIDFPNGATLTIAEIRDKN